MAKMCYVIVMQIVVAQVMFTDHLQSRTKLFVR